MNAHRILLPLAALASLALAEPPKRNITFLAASDSHYREPDHRLGSHNHLNRATIEEMNQVHSLTWPEKLGGGAIDKPRGLVMPGDLIDDGDRKENDRNLSAEQYRLFEADLGLDGTDGLLKFPVFEGWGNHDGPPVGKEKNGFSSQAQIKRRNLQRQQKNLISNLSPNGLHYSWDWDDVHFVQLNFYPADQQHAEIRYSPVWHDPQGALTFLKEDLAAKVGTSGRPVVLTAHCGFDTNWWHPEDWANVYNAAKPYNVILYIYGHTGTGTGAWAPAGETRKWITINDGHFDTGFFVIQIHNDQLRAAYRMKAGRRTEKGPDGRNQHHWDGQWEWKWLLSQSINPQPQHGTPPSP